DEAAVEPGGAARAFGTGRRQQTARAGFGHRQTLMACSQVLGNGPQDGVDSLLRSEPRAESVSATRHGFKQTPDLVGACPHAIFGPFQFVDGASPAGRLLRQTTRLVDIMD